MVRVKSDQLFDRARSLMPGGVNSPVRAFSAVGGHPVFVARGDGAQIWDVDGNSYIDFVGSFGPLILGHRHPVILDAIAEALNFGTCFGAPTEAEIELAHRINQAMPSIEMVRLVNSGTEATMSAIRVARAYTGRDLIVKFVGCYHGHVDSLLVQAGSGLASLGIASTPGVPAAFTETTIPLPYNDLQAAEDVFRLHGGRIAAVIVEPVAGNMGCIPPAEGFLKCLRDLTHREGALLIFDEVITGFRLGYGGAQALFEITPDLTTLGKIIGGGLPVGAYGGRADIMRMIAPEGQVYQAGTLSGNPLAAKVGVAVLDYLAENAQLYDRLENRASALCAIKVPGVTANRVGSMFSYFFTSEKVGNWEDAKSIDTRKYATYFHEMLGQGIFVAPSQYECMFLSAAHSDSDLSKTAIAIKNSLEIASQSL